MNVDTAVFVTDAVNRQNSRLPLDTIVQSMERPLAEAIEFGAPYGMPANLSHDLCRPIGWSVPRGVYLAKDMARLLGQTLRAETEEERQAIHSWQWSFIERHQARQLEPHVDTLRSKVAAHSSDRLRFWHAEAAAVTEPGLASAMLPEYFMADSKHVDKNGLVDFAFLLSRCTQILPGVFHETERDVLLFAHRFFRRSLSLKNSLNPYVLQSFAEAASLNGVTARLRLDPDMVGIAASAKGIVELEYWHGPKYSDDIAAIPSGVSEHKNSEYDRLMSGVDKTQVWWKNPETRARPDDGHQIRTFESEELIENESSGLADGRYGCRYAHAEYDLQEHTISHFDGAIRAYAGDAYLNRIDQPINRAGKHAEYTKLFRLDGPLPVPVWKCVLTDWYRGNRLIPEYLGAPEADLVEALPSPPSPVPPQQPALAAFLCLEQANGPAPETITLVPDQAILLGGEQIACAETSRGHLRMLAEPWLLPGAMAIAAHDGETNLARIVLPGEPPDPSYWQSAAEQLATAIAGDEADGSLNWIALAISWTRSGILTTLSVEGEARLVSALLAATASLVHPEKLASDWIEAFRDALLEHAPGLTAPVNWPPEAATRGRLMFERQGDIEFDLGLGVESMI